MAEVQDRNIFVTEPIRDTGLSELSQPLKVLTLNAGNLGLLYDTSEPPTSCDDPRCQSDEITSMYNILYEVVNNPSSDDGSGFPSDFGIIDNLNDITTISMIEMIGVALGIPAEDVNLLDIIYDLEYNPYLPFSIPSFPNCCKGWSDFNGFRINPDGGFTDSHTNCVGNELSRRTDEQQLRSFIEERQPEIIVITELLDNNSESYGCMDSDCYEAVESTTHPLKQPMRNNPKSSCYQFEGPGDNPQQVERVIPSNYQLSCTDPIYTCIATRDDIGNLNYEYGGTSPQCPSNAGFIEPRIICTSMELDYPSECEELGNIWPVNTSYINLTLNDGTPIRIIATHPMNLHSLEKDMCRTALLRQAFEEISEPTQNVIIAGDFNMDPYRLDVRPFLNWSSEENISYVRDFMKDVFDNWNTHPTVNTRTAFHVGDPVYGNGGPQVADLVIQDIPEIGECPLNINLWDFQTNLIDGQSVNFSIQDANGNEIPFDNLGQPNVESPFYDFNIFLDWDYFGFKFCLDSVYQFGACTYLEIPSGIGINPYPGGCGVCNFYPDAFGTFEWGCDGFVEAIFRGRQGITLRYNAPYTNDNGVTIYPEPQLAGLSTTGMNFDFEGTAGSWPLDNPIVENVINNLLSEQIPSLFTEGIDLGKTFESLQPLSYNFIRHGVSSIPVNYQTSTELFHQYVDTVGRFSKFNIHNQPDASNSAPPPVTFSLGNLVNLTFDYILSTFNTASQCNTYEFPFMDHEALMCQLYQVGDVNQDATVDVLDIISIVDYVLGQTTHLEPGIFALADVNNDGNVDILDLTTLVNNIINLPTTSSLQKQQLTNQLERLQNVNIDKNQTQNINTDVEIKPILEYMNYRITETQAFYFFDAHKILNRERMIISPNQVFIAECNDLVVGYTRVTERYIDVEVMGASNLEGTTNYCNFGDTVTFSIVDLVKNTKFVIQSNNIETFTPNATFNVNINELEQVNNIINKEVEKLEQAYQKKNWESVNEIIKKLNSEFDKNNK